MRAYFSYINARRARSDGKRGVYGRQIVLKVYDDGYQEAQTVQQTRRAVEQDRVFAMLGGLGHGEPAGRARVHEPAQGAAALRLHRPQRVRAPVPAEPVVDRLAAGLHPGGHPARALRPREPAEREGRECSGRTTTTAGAPPGLPDQRRSRPRHRHRDATRVAAAPPSSPVPTARLRASGADTFLIIATPAETITALVTAYRLGWRPNKLVNSVGATDTWMTAARSVRGLARRGRGHRDDGLPQGPGVAEVPRTTRR